MKFQLTDDGHMIVTGETLEDDINLNVLADYVREEGGSLRDLPEVPDTEPEENERIRKRASIYNGTPLEKTETGSRILNMEPGDVLTIQKSNEDVAGYKSVSSVVYNLGYKTGKRFSVRVASGLYIIKRVS